MKTVMSFMLIRESLRRNFDHKDFRSEEAPLFYMIRFRCVRYSYVAVYLLFFDKVVD